VIDYIIEKDKIFAYLNLDDQELTIYNKLYSLLIQELPKPDMTIYLQANFETLKERIKKRNLPYEKNISDDYLKQVIKAFDYFFFHYKETPLLVINTNRIDFVMKDAHFDEMVNAIKTIRGGTQYFTPWLGEE